MATPTETHQNAAVVPLQHTNGRPLLPTPTITAVTQLQVQVVVPAAGWPMGQVEEAHIPRREARAAMLAGAVQPVAEPSGKQSLP